MERRGAVEKQMEKQELKAARNDVRQKQIQSRGLSFGGFGLSVTKTSGHNKTTEQGL